MVPSTWMIGQAFEHHAHNTKHFLGAFYFLSSKSKRRLKTKQHTFQAREEEPVVCSRTSSELIVEIVKAFGYK